MNKVLIICMFICFSTTAIADSAVQKLYKKVNDSVVELHVKAISAPEAGKVKYKVSTSKSLGSGALISDTGRILTAAHVVSRATDIKVVFNDGSSTSGHVVWVDTLIDLAMIQAAKLPKEIKPLKLAKPNNYNIGEQVVVIGAPYGVSHSLSVGYLSGIRDREKIPGTNLVPRFLQTDASINRGNSGGPMFNLDGEIIGIVSHILSQSGGSNGLGFVVSVDTILDVIDSDPGTFSGFIPYLLTEKQAFAINIPYGYGMLVQQVIPNTIADRLGFKGGNFNVVIGRTPVLLGGDVLFEINGMPIKDLKSVMKIKQKFTEYKVGDKITFKFIRDGKEKEITWTVD